MSGASDMGGEQKTRESLAAFARDFDWSDTLEDTDSDFAAEEIVGQLRQGEDGIAAELESEEWADFLRAELIASLERARKAK